MALSNTHFILRASTLAFFCLMIFISACTDHGNQEAKTVINSAPPTDTVQVFLLKKDTLKKVVELQGELIPMLQTDLYAKVQGYVQSMKVDIGDRVRKGQTLAVIEAPEVNSQVAQSEASLLAARAKLSSSTDQYNRLYKASLSNSPGIVAPVELENSRNQMLSDSATYEAIHQQSKSYKEVSGYLYIISPFDGVIIARKTDPGALVNASAMLLTVQDNNTLRLRVAVPELYVAAATANHNLTFSVDAYPEQRFSGILTRKTETIDPATRTELWEFEVNNRQHLLKAGTFVYARIGLSRSTTSFILPVSAIASTLERKFVIKISDEKVEWVDVRQGMITDAGVEVFGDLKVGDTLLLKSTDERKPGSKAFWRLVH